MKKVFLQALCMASSFVMAQRHASASLERQATPSDSLKNTSVLFRTTASDQVLVDYGVNNVIINQPTAETGASTNFRLLVEPNGKTNFFVPSSKNLVFSTINYSGRPNLTFFAAGGNALSYAGVSPSLELNKDGSLSFYSSIWGTRNSSAWQNTGKMLTLEQDGKVSIGDNKLASLGNDYKLSVDGKIVANQVHASGFSIFGPMPDANLLGQLNNCAAVPLDNAVPPLRLFANGTIGCAELRVNPTSWCDYVFGKDYKLKDLKEVESYIEAQHHLPEVPSEKDVKDQGVYVSEMFKVHMKKIEELTLYLIEQNKRIEALAKDNERLANQMKALQQK